MSTRPALALLLALAAPTRAGAGEVRAEADLHVRFTSTVNRPAADVLYDPTRRTFALDGYLVPAESDRYGSAFASVRVEGTTLDGDLVLRLAVDTGEVRRRAFQEVEAVCLTPLSGTGLAPPGSAGCGPLAGRRIVALESVTRGPEELTSNGRPIEDEVEATWLVRDLSATLSVGRAGFARLAAGRRRTVVGDGLVHDDYATGAEVALDLGAIGPPFEVAAAAFVPSRDWPTSGEAGSTMLSARAAWLPSLFESVGVFAAALRERTGSLAETLRGQNVERIGARLAQAQAEPGVTQDERDAAVLLARTLSARYESDATLLWFGTTGALSPWRGHRIGWTAAALEGNVASISIAELGDLVEDVALHGRAVRATWDVDLPAGLSAGAAFLWLSGGELPLATYRDQSLTPGTGEYRGFLGVAPFVPYTNLFFGGGLTNTFAARETTAPGVNGRGVLSPRVRVAWDPSERLGLEARVAWLRADVAGPYGGKDYGVEVDLVASFLPAPWLALGLEVDALWPGDFYGGDDTVYRTVLAVDVLTP